MTSDEMRVVVRKALREDIDKKNFLEFCGEVYDDELKRIVSADKNLVVDIKDAIIDYITMRDGITKREVLVRLSDEMLERIAIGIVAEIVKL